jgi:hypothetical protein
MMRREDVRVYLTLVRAGLGEPWQLEPEGGRALAGVNWDWITASARRHHLGNLLFEGIRRLYLERWVPSRTWRSLQSSYYTNLAHNLLLFDHAQSLMEGARQGSAPLILLKGVSFAGWLYPSPALRPMGDLDLLVRAQDLRYVRRLAEKMGYQRHDATDHAVSLRHRQSGTYLELHTSLTSCPDYMGIKTESLFERSKSTSHLNARTLSVEDHLLHLCLHGCFQHGFRQTAVNALDTYLLSLRADFDWKQFIERASAPRLAPIVYGGLSLSHHVFPSERMRDALEALMPLVPPRQRTRAEGLRIHSLLSPAAESVFGSPWARILWAPGPADGMALARETLSNSSAGHHPPNHWPSIRRGVALLWRHGLSGWVRRVFVQIPPKAKPRPLDLTPVSIGESTHV